MTISILQFTDCHCSCVFYVLIVYRSTRRGGCLFEKAYNICIWDLLSIGLSCAVEEMIFVVEEMIFVVLIAVVASSMQLGSGDN